MDALVEAVVRLLAKRSAADLSVRDIAAEAGVNHGLVHHYFGSKDALVRAAVIRTSDRVTREHPPGVRMRWSFDLFRRNPILARVVARACLDGPHDLLELAAPPPEVLSGRADVLGRAFDGLGVPRVVDFRVVNALASAVLLGWIVFRPLFDAGFDLPADADDQIAAALDLADALVTRAAGAQGPGAAAGPSTS